MEQHDNPATPFEEIGAEAVDPQDEPVDPIEEAPEDAPEDPDKEPEADPENPEDAPADPNAEPEKFRGKTREEIMQAYTSLERSTEARAAARARSIAEAATAADAKALEDIMKEFEGQDFEKMTPKEFGKFIITSMNKVAMRQAQATYERNAQVRTAVNSEIREAVTSHPHLKTNADYREYVIGQIELGETRGKKVSLIDACKKADQVFKITPGKPAPAAKPAAPVRRPNPGVERPGPIDKSKEMTDEQKVRDGMLNLSKSTGGLGGLGI